MSGATLRPRSQEWPPPAPRCGVCRALVHQRSEAAAVGDDAKVADLNAELRQHRAPARNRERTRS